MAGGIILLEGDLNSNLETSSHLVYWERTFYSPQIECDEQIIPNYLNPENDVLCLVSLNKMTHSSANAILGPTEHQVNALIEVYDENMNRISQTEFTNDLFGPTPVRINAVDLEYGDYYTKLNFSNTGGIYFSEEIGQFSVENYQSGGQVDDNREQFDFDLISVRDTAAAGDEILLAWATNGGISEYFLVEVFAETELVDSYYVLNDGAEEGEFNIELPSDLNSYINHRIQITAFNNLLESSIDIVNLEGISQQVYLEVNVNPDRPNVGSMVD